VLELEFLPEWYPRRRRRNRRLAQFCVIGLAALVVAAGLLARVSSPPTHDRSAVGPITANPDGPPRKR
jgi:hypothetical protein